MDISHVRFIITQLIDAKKCSPALASDAHANCTNCNLLGKRLCAAEIDWSVIYIRLTLLAMCTFCEWYTRRSGSHWAYVRIDGKCYFAQNENRVVSLHLLKSRVDVLIWHRIVLYTSRWRNHVRLDSFQLAESKHQQMQKCSSIQGVRYCLLNEMFMDILWLAVYGWMPRMGVGNPSTSHRGSGCLVFFAHICWAFGAFLRCPFRSFCQLNYDKALSSHLKYELYHRRKCRKSDLINLTKA